MTFQEIKDSVDIVEVVGNYAELIKAGHAFKARENPIREERTSSFFVYSDTQRYHDFGSGGGDVIDFIEAAEHLDKHNAALFLQEKYIGNTPTHRARVIPPNQNPIKPKYDLQEIHTSCINTHISMGDKFNDYLFKLIHPSVFGMSREVLERCKSILGFSTKYQSLTVHVMDGNEVKAVAIRQAGDAKWKTYGAKTFTPYRIKPDDGFVFFFSGMAERIIMDALDWSYIGIQSDSMMRHIPAEAIHLCRDKSLVVLSDNDKSFKDLISGLTKMFSSVVIIDFEIILDRNLPKGYDFRDFCNEVGKAKDIRKQIENEIVFTLLGGNK